MCVVGVQTFHDFSVFAVIPGRQTGRLCKFMHKNCWKIGPVSCPQKGGGNFGSWPMD